MSCGHPILLLDSCCLLNLYATRHLREIALGSPFQFGVTEYVVTHEALYVWKSPENGFPGEAEPLDLQPLVREESIVEFHLETHEEELTFVDFSAGMDNGEAETGAIALHRGYSLATDDRKARRIFRKFASSAPLVSALELLNQWALLAEIPVPKLREAMFSMQTGATFVPGRRVPLFRWWKSVLDG